MLWSACQTALILRQLIDRIGCRVPNYGKGWLSCFHDILATLQAKNSHKSEVSKLIPSLVLWAFLYVTQVYVRTYVCMCKTKVINMRVQCTLHTHIEHRVLYTHVRIKISLVSHMSASISARCYWCVKRVSQRGRAGMLDEHIHTSRYVHFVHVGCYRCA